MSLFKKAKKAQEMCNNSIACNAATTPIGTAVPGAIYWNTIGNTAAPTCTYKKCAPEVKKEEGNNPMRYEDINMTVAPSISIEAGASETATQRKYLEERLRVAFRVFEYGDKDTELRKAFHLYGPHSPRTYKELIDAIQGGKFTLDEKLTKHVDEAAKNMDDGGYYDYDVFDGIIFNDFPRADYEGYNKVKAAINKKYQETKDIIAILDPKDGLAALQAFEAWTPTAETDTVH